MESEAYQVVIGHAFEPYENPTAITEYSSGTAQHQTQAEEENHKKQLQQCKEQCNVISALRNQVTNVFEQPFLQAKNYLCIGFQNCMMPELFQYLHDNHGKNTNSKILNNKEDMKQEWDPNTLNKTLHKQIEDSAEYAAQAGLDIPDKEKIAIACNLIYKIGELNAVHKDWRRKPESNKTQESFKTHFTEEHLDCKEDNNTITSS